jgi:ferredoxin-NADP reductase/mono/diheme cytochrome c family protein
MQPSQAGNKNRSWRVLTTEQDSCAGSQAKVSLAKDKRVMLSSSASLVLGLVFVIIAVANVWLALQASLGRDENNTTRLLAAHRIGGYLFVAVFCVMGYFMFSRLRNMAGGAGPMSGVHLISVMILAPLVFIKVLIARHYKNYYGLLMPLGLGIFVLSFLLIAATAGPYLARLSNMQKVSVPAVDQPSTTIDLNQAGDMMQQRCSRCHNLDRVMMAVKDASGWLATVKRMQSLPGSGIAEEDVAIIVSYLTSQVAPQGSDVETRMKVARALVDQRCGRCHSLDRVYKTEQSPEEWRATVNRMVSHAAGSPGALQPGEDQQIIAFLSATQTPEAVNQRGAQVAAATSTGLSLVAAKPSGTAPSPPQSSRHDVATIVFIAFVAVSVLALTIYRPKRRPIASSPPVISVPAASGKGGLSSRELSTEGTLILKLVRITQQTPDSKTLRFAVADGINFSPRPGQFLSFSFLLDGRKVIRCYSICSSAARTGYVEITPKRVHHGCASVFLNDRASIGMTVEATGPFGQFCLDPERHETIALIGAGSGITPLMAMLRYIQDMALPTMVTLLYCVRSVQDIMFQEELKELSTRIAGFSYHVLLSQPDVGWTGWSGHISEQFITSAVPAISDQDFFLCGPPPFMEKTRGILATLGVQPQHILQESFGVPAPSLLSQDLGAHGAGVSVEFIRSRKTCLVGDGQSLLEAAEQHGIAIPYSCRRGQCGTCKTRLLEGTVRMDAEQGLDSNSKKAGYVLLCVGHPICPVKLDA